MTKSNLPIEVHDHFRKANILHTYVLKDLDEAAKHALETGQELLAAKSAVPHGSWEDECTRLFDGSLRTAQFYMQFTKDMGSITKAQNSSLLMLEGTLDGAAKAARKAAIAAGGKPAPKPSPPAQPPPQSGDPFDEPAREPQPETGGRRRSHTDDAPHAGPGAPESPETAPEPERPDESTDEPERSQATPGGRTCRNCMGRGIVTKRAGFAGERDYQCPQCGGTGKVPDYGKCPNCLGAKWKEDESGVFCAKCGHPWGESTGGPDEDRITTQRSKARKTAEALMRAIDDLQALKARKSHDEAIRLCKKLLDLIKEWK